MVAAQADVPLATSFIINLSYPNQPVGVVVKDKAIGWEGFGIDFGAGTER